MQEVGGIGWQVQILLTTGESNLLSPIGSTCCLACQCAKRISAYMNISMISNGQKIWADSSETLSVQNMQMFSWKGFSILFWFLYIFYVSLNIFQYFSSEHTFPMYNPVFINSVYKTATDTIINSIMTYISIHKNRQYEFFKLCVSTLIGLYSKYDTKTHFLYTIFFWLLTPYELEIRIKGTAQPK